MLRFPMGWLLLWALNATALADTYQVVVERPFEDVMMEISIAAAERNFAQVGMNRVGDAIRQHLDEGFPRATVVHICNLEVAHQFLRADPDYLLYLPCKITVFEGEEGVVISTRLFPEDDPRVRELSARVNALLREIVDFPSQ